jgi:hypothetical protein
MDLTSSMNGSRVCGGSKALSATRMSEPAAVRAEALAVRRVLKALFLILSVALGQAAGSDQADAVRASGDRQVLVMLRMPPAHYQPNAGYGGEYGSQTGHAARRRIASELAAVHGLVVESEWPMASVGIDCFLMRVPAGRPLAAILDAVSLDSRIAWVQLVHEFHSN